ncbi:caspase family protein [Rhodococcus sp. 1168]|uniref:caspase family protein n=1 Tax=Rhodococcus sp. 1168 TaxID=2018041 RepID=UPI000A0D266F|nr:caspase family protein [Rhodococcus sp. 1168]ORI28143.1 peptidase C14 [Rhodococcus sp. 1168]
MRKALIIGIDHYADDQVPDLSGCVNDAYSVKQVLERHADGTMNFRTPKLLVASSGESAISKRELKDAVTELFDDDAEVALLYFSGHGHLESTGGYVCASDSVWGDDGLPLADIMTLANNSKARNKVVILDSCHSGAVGESTVVTSVSEIREGVTILTASAANQASMITPGGGSSVFTELFVDALNGAAANLLGAVTPGSVYAHVDQSLGPWKQRPVFKTNVKAFVSLREADPPIELEHLKAVTTHFPTPDHQLALDPSYEPERSAEQIADPDVPDPDPAHTAAFAVLQKLVRVNLVRPVDAPHMWHAAMGSKSCELTVLGQHYWKLVDSELI